MHYIVTYPRSGTAWTIHRVRLILDRMCARGDISEEDRPPIKSNHLGFHPSKGIDGTGNRRNHIKEGDHLSVILRDGRKSIVSNFYWLFSQVCQHDQKTFERKFSKFNVNEFVRSEWGARRFARYLNRLQEYKYKRYEIDFYYYEDIATREFAFAVPKILGLNAMPTEEDAEAMYKLGKAKVNLCGTDHDALSKESAEYIQKTLDKHCELPEYRSKYLIDP